MQEHEERLAKAFKSLVSGFIAYPEDCELDAEDQGPRGIYAVVKCNRADRSRLIGKAGRNARAIGEILKAMVDGVGSRIQFRYSVLEGYRGQEEPEVPFAFDERWGTENSKAFASRVHQTLSLFDPEVRVKTRDPVYGTTVVEITTGLTYGPALVISLSDIFGAIGRAMGRGIKIEISNGDSPLLSRGYVAGKKQS